MSLRILIAPSGFKECIEADEVAARIAQGVLRAVPDAELTLLPLVDGGEGFCRILCNLTQGTMIQSSVTGPTGQPVQAHFGFLGGAASNTAIIEIAAAAGLRLVPSTQRDPTATTTRGVGELMLAAMDHGAQAMVVGCGDSGTNDAGAGAAQALGVRLLDAKGRGIGPGGQELLKVRRIDLDSRDLRLRHLPLRVACNWQNVLCGPSGVARVYGGQKGASQAQIDLLESALEHFAEIIERDLGIDVRSMPGGGASGGLGAGLHALLGGQLYPRMDIVREFLNFDLHLSRSDLVITAEGQIDRQTLHGKVPAEIARLAQKFQIPVIALSGAVSVDAKPLLESGFDAFESILNAPYSLSEAMKNAPALLEDAAEQALRLILIGERLSKSSSQGAQAQP